MKNLNNFYLTKNRAALVLLFLVSMVPFSCQDYLSVVPDDIPTIDHAFSNRESAEKFLFSCYSYLPNPADPFNTPGLMESRECWLLLSSYYYVAGDYSGNNLYSWRVARGLQNTNSTYLNFWDGARGGSPLFVALRDCNIFLENIDKVTGLRLEEKQRWIAEIKFLKAYYHFFLLRMYGPIPVIRDNLSISANPDDVRVYREPVEAVADYIVSLLDEAAAVLPAEITSATEEMGRLTKPIALAVKAQVLTLMASPIFNGNPYYRGFADNRGTLLFPQEADPDKWVTAAEAIRQAIESAETEGNSQLFNFTELIGSSDVLKTEMSIRGAVSERWNSEIIWGSTKDEDQLQRLSIVRTDDDFWTFSSSIAPTLDMAELFYTKNGLPIAEDKEYAAAYPDLYQTKKATSEYADYIQNGFVTANLHFDREPRFYANLTFDGGYYFGNGNNKRIVEMKRGNLGGVIATDRYSITGYFPKKLINRESSLSKTGWIRRFYSYPYIRLADLYLLYAEALNEVKATPDDEVFEYMDKVRERAGLIGVKETWSSAVSLHPEYLNNKDRMREIIHRERLIELSFENAPYWDILRWKEAEQRWNGPIRGWNVFGTRTLDYYHVSIIDNSTFTYKDYLAPIRQNNIDVNRNLKQNPGW
jgi:hypothetical protein